MRQRKKRKINLGTKNATDSEFLVLQTDLLYLGQVLVRVVKVYTNRKKVSHTGTLYKPDLLTTL
jgi:hypothetical protein